MADNKTGFITKYGEAMVHGVIGYLSKLAHAEEMRQEKEFERHVADRPGSFGTSRGGSCDGWRILRRKLEAREIVTPGMIEIMLEKDNVEVHVDVLELYSETPGASGDMINLGLELVYKRPRKDNGKKTEVLDRLVQALEKMNYGLIDPIHYGQLMRGYGHENFARIESIFKRMKKQKQKHGHLVERNNWAMGFGCMIDACAKTVRMDMCEVVIDEMRGEELNLTPVHCTLVLSAYARVRNVPKGYRFFKQMPEMGIPYNLTHFNKMIDLCISGRDTGLAMKMLAMMEDFKVVPDIITYSTLVKGCTKNGEMDGALKYFELAKKKLGEDGIDEIMYNSLLDGCVASKDAELAERILREMTQGRRIDPSCVTFCILVRLHASLGNLDAAHELVFEKMPKYFGVQPNVAVYSCLLQLALKKGDPIGVEAQIRQYCYLTDERIRSIKNEVADRTGKHDHGNMKGDFGLSDRNAYSSGDSHHQRKSNDHWEGGSNGTGNYMGSSEDDSETIPSGRYMKSKGGSMNNHSSKGKGKNNNYGSTRGMFDTYKNHSKGGSYLKRSFEDSEQTKAGTSVSESYHERPARGRNANKNWYNRSEDHGSLELSSDSTTWHPEHHAAGVMMSRTSTTQSTLRPNNAVDHEDPMRAHHVYHHVATPNMPNSEALPSAYAPSMYTGGMPTMYHSTGPVAFHMGYGANEEDGGYGGVYNGTLGEAGEYYSSGMQRYNPRMMVRQQNKVVKAGAADSGKSINSYESIDKKFFKGSSMIQLYPRLDNDLCKTKILEDAVMEGGATLPKSESLPTIAGLLKKNSTGKDKGKKKEFYLSKKPPGLCTPVGGSEEIHKKYEFTFGDHRKNVLKKSDVSTALPSSDTSSDCDQAIVIDEDDQLRVI